MTYVDAKQWLRTEAPPEVLAALEKDRQDILREHLRTLGAWGRTLDIVRTASRAALNAIDGVTKVEAPKLFSGSVEATIVEQQAAARRLK